MSIYELTTDYVNYSKALGLRDSKVVRYVFRNAMLPQITGLALSFGTMLGGALVTESVFSYPGMGSLLFSAIRQNDYPVIHGVTLILTFTVLLANFLVDIAYGFIDPRVRGSDRRKIMGEVLTLLFRSRRFIAGLIMFICVLAFGLFGPFFSDINPFQSVGGLYDSPSKTAWLGTDNLGRDVFTGLMYGTRTSLLMASLPVVSPR